MVIYSGMIRPMAVLGATRTSGRPTSHMTAGTRGRSSPTTMSRRVSLSSNGLPRLERRPTAGGGAVILKTKVAPWCRRTLAVALCLTAAHSTRALAQAVCPPRAYFRHELEEPARLISADTIDAPRLDTKGPQGENVVQFIVDSTGTPIMRSFRFLIRHDSALFAAFHADLVRWRFDPARGPHQCKVAQLVIGTITWPPSHFAPLKTPGTLR